MATKCPKCQSENPETATFCADCGTRLSLQEGVSVTKTLISPAAERNMVAERYRILGKLGEGGMGVVYKAEDTRLKRTVALKFMPPELTRDSEAKERFIREAQAAAALSHPNICTVYEVDEEDGQSFISMEYIEGQSIRERVKRGPLDVMEALGIAIKAARGLEEAHKKGIVHRDIKSANIMVTGSGQAKVMDFGLAKVLGASLITKEAKTMGTVAYMSPEQAQGQSVDHRTDIWSLGIVLYEMLTGQLPFRGEYDQSMIHSILSREPEPLTKVCSNLPKDLENVVLTALAKNPADRYQDMDELLKDLKAIGQELKPLGAKVGLLRQRVFGIKKAYAFAGLATFILLIALAVIFLIPKGGQAYDSIAILPLVNDSGDPDQEYFANSMTDAIITDLYKISALRVVPRQSVMGYKNSSKPLKEIAKELNVEAVVEASVLKSGNRVRLIARLIDPGKNTQLWSDKYEREYSEILFLQSDLSQAIANGIKAVVKPEEQARLASARQINPEAYDIYLQTYSECFSGPSSQVIIDYLKWIDNLKRATSLDPDFALAYSFMGYLYLMLGLNGHMPENEVYPKAKEAILKAVELDDTLADAHKDLGWIKVTLDWNWIGAEMEFKRALELAPGSHFVQYDYSVFLRAIRRFDDALVWISRLEKSAPGVFDFQRSSIYLCAGRYDDALEEAKEEVSRDPHYQNQLQLAYAYEMKGMYAEALSQMDKVMAFPGAQNTHSAILELARIQALLGKREQALKTFENLKSLYAQRNVDASVFMAAFFVALGDKDQAFKHLEDAYKKHLGTITLISEWIHYHDLYGDPRFQDLLRRINFPL